MIPKFFHDGFKKPCYKQISKKKFPCGFPLPPRDYFIIKGRELLPPLSGGVLW